MPKWLVKRTLTELEKIDKLKESNKISQAEHDRRSKASVEKALQIEKNIIKKEHKDIIGKCY